MFLCLVVYTPARAEESVDLAQDWKAFASCPMPTDKFVAKLKEMDLRMVKHFEKMSPEKRKEIYEKNDFKDVEAFSLRIFAPFFLKKESVPGFDQNCWALYRKVVSKPKLNSKDLKQGLEAWRGCVVLNYRDDTPDYFIKLTKCLGD